MSRIQSIAHLPYPIPAKKVWFWTFGIFTLILFFLTFWLQLSCNPVLWWQTSQAPQCLETQLPPILQERFKIEPHQLSIQPGKSTKIEARLDGEIINNRRVNWASSNPEIISIDRRGILCAHKGNQDAIVTGTLPARLFEDHPKLKDRIYVHSDFVINQGNKDGNGGHWKIAVIAGVVVGIGTTVVTGNPIAGVGAGVGTAIGVGFFPDLGTQHGQYFQCKPPQ